MSFYDGKTALVSGAAQGLGLQIATRLLREGANVFVCDLQDEKLASTAARLQGEFPRARVGSLAGDVRDGAFLDRLEAAVDAFAPHSLDILVNNAGVVFGGNFLERPMAEHRATFEINTLALVEMTHRFLPRLLKSREARLLQISSVTSFIGLPGGTTYAASKWGVTGFSEGIRLELKELGHTNVRVKIVCPSYISTGMFDGAKAPLLMPPLDPGQLADRIVSFLPGNTVYLKAPFMAKTTRFIQGFFPLFMQDFIMKFLGVQSSMSHWQGHRTAATAAAGTKK